jgi:hypothetical protein
LGYAAVKAGHHARFLGKFVYRGGPSFLHPGAPEGIPPDVVPDDDDEVGLGRFALENQARKHKCEEMK